MKTNTLIFLCVLVVIAGIVSIIAMPEGRVIEYRPDTSNGRHGTGGMQIQVVIENGLDNYIPCDALSLKEITAMCDSLNRQIR